jgi:hypothetical protein
MGVNVSASSEYEAEANRVRKEIDETVKELRSRLRPSSLASEAAGGVGLTDASWAGAFEFASKRHPVPTAIVGLGIALWALAAIRNRSRRGGVASLTSPLRESSDSLVESASRVFRDRAELKRRELVRVAQAHIATGAERLSDKVESKLDDVVGQLPGGSEVRPLIASAIQIALTAALEGLLRKDPHYP